MDHPTCGAGARWCARADAILDVPDMHVLEVEIDEQRLVLTVESGQLEAACPTCRVVAVSHGRRVRMLHDMPCFGRVTLLRWLVRIWRCREPQCATQTFSEARSGAASDGVDGAGADQVRRVRTSAGAGTDDPKARREAARPGHPHRRGPGGAGRAQVGPGADSKRTFTRAPTGSARSVGPRTRSLRSTCWGPTPTNGCWTPTSRPVLMRSPHPALMAWVRRRIKDRRVLGLVNAFLKAGVLSEDGITRDTKTGAPQGGSATRGRTL